MTKRVELTEIDLAAKSLAKRDKRAKTAFGYAATTGGTHLTVKYLPEVIQNVEAKLAQVARKGTADYDLERVIRHLDKEVIALICLSGVLLATSKHSDRYHTGILIAVGKDLEDECFYQGLLQSDRKAAGRINKMVALQHGDKNRRRAAARHLASKDYVQDGKLIFKAFQMEEWTEDKRLEAGAWCFNRVMSALPNVFRWTVTSGGYRYPQLSAAAEAEAAEAIQAVILRSPVWQPRATCPQQWVGWTNKVSADPAVRAANLMKTYHKATEAAVRAAIANGQAAPALKGLNALQSVPFQINTWLLDVLKRAPAGVLPATHTVEPNANVSLSDTMRLNRKHKANWTRRIADIATADKCATDGVFYTPMNFEWRTRVNSIPMFNYQREDHIRALFLFKEGKPITQKGINWLQIHIANCGDFEKVSKASFDKRLAWTEANMRYILAAAADPIKDPEFIGPTMGEIWQYADCPFLFLAACKELSDCNGDPNYISHLPGAWDGACNGLQHLAAMTRGLEEGRNVNLTDSDKPLDIYQLVADEVKKMVAQDQIVSNASNDPKIELERKYSNMLAAYGVNRGLVKRCVMTFCYGSKEFGMGNHIITDTMDAEQARVIEGAIDNHPFGDPVEQRGAARYIASRTYDAILKIVSKPAEAMKLFQECAAKLGHEGKVLSWVTPAGMPLVNRYHERETQQVTLWLHDRGVPNKLRAQVAVGSAAKVDKTRVKNGAAPNIVHACDASHLLLTAGACADAGIQLATVHDSYATHLCDTDRMLEILRGEFVRMYQEHDVLAEVLASAAADFEGDKRRQLPPHPERGQLDLDAVKRAKYAFA